ncbi:MAG: Holliday junction branch migration protein RuvA [Thermoanaerobaculaceae bacterium]|nr:Holliday junction branch migration protein RuvA [Thermoanaerobaculaceae bacterium]
MIARLKGKVLEKNPTSLVIDVNGVGYLVSVPITTSSAIKGEETDLFVHTEVRTDSIQLFGFLRKEERELFCTLRNIHGIGPQTALAILSSMSYEDFFIAIKEQNAKRFIGIPKVGKKTAERILLELKEKDLPFVATVSSEERSPSERDTIYEAVCALESLGYKTNEALNAVNQAKNQETVLNVENLVKIALQILSH